MKKKHSVCMGIAVVITLLYLLYLSWYCYDSYTASVATKKYGETVGIALAITILIPHIGLTALAFIFLVVAFFSNIFGMALTAGILFCVAALAFIMYAPFLIPSIVLSFVGSAFCQKQKRLLREDEEERQYQQQKNVQGKPQRNTQQQVRQQDLGYQRQAYPQNSANQMPQQYANNQMAAQPYGNVTYAQDPYMPLDQSMMNTMYAQNPTPVQPMNWQQPQMVPQQQMVQNQMYYQPNETAMYPQTQEMYNAPAPMNQQANDGYFDDNGKFHFFNENNR